MSCGCRSGSDATNGNWALGDYKKALGDKLAVAPLPAGPAGPAAPMLGVDGLVDEDEEYATLAGYLLTRFGQLPKVGDVCVLEQSDAVYRFKVEELEGRRISQVSLERAPYDDEQIDPFLAS